MSDEPTPPRTRLKPRLGVPAQEPTQPVSPTPPAPEPGPEPLLETPADQATADLLRLRLKPKASSPRPAASEAEAVFGAPPPATVPPPPQPPPPAIEAPSRTPTQPPFLPPPAPAVPHLRPANNVPEVKAPPVAKARTSAVYKADKWLAAVAIVLALAGIFYAFRFVKKHIKPDAARAAASAPATSTPAPAAQTPVAAGTPTSMAGKAVAKAREAVAAHDQAASITPILATQDAGEPAPKADLPPPPPSDAFRAFVVNLRISGVFQGEPARALLNGKMHRVGDVVDARLDIKLTGIDPEAKQLIFTDASGATMPRHY